MVGKIVLGVAGGVLLAVLVLYGLFWFVSANDETDCAAENVDRSIAGQPLLDCG